MSNTALVKPEVVAGPTFSEPEPLTVVLREFRDSLDALRSAIRFATDHADSLARRLETIQRLTGEQS